jgi:isoleucyl-tRNA synthetase
MAQTTPLYPPLARKYHDAQSEQLISQFWRENDIFQRSIAQREGASDFVFYEGPPTANGLPGVHHVMSRLCKDIMCRFKAMIGYRVLRKAGWDTHGLPVERAVEKELGIQGRQDIEEYGVAPFNQACRRSVWSCREDWNEFTERVGYWIDLDHPYITYDNEYIETVWWILKRFGDEGLLYQGLKVVPFCPICGTPLSSHETAAGYRTVSEASIYVKLKAVDAEEYFVTWTTTPWTLPSNVALAVGLDFDYVRVRYAGEVLILAEARLSILPAEGKVEILERFKGKDLIGRHYEALFPFLQPGDKNAFVVVPADFVTLDAGSGIVHMAPAFGEDDFQVGQRENLAVFRPVDEAGRFTSEVPPYAGANVKEADPQIIAHLREQGRLLAEEIYSHDYPFHDRCNSPLIYYATPSWFIRTSQLREQLLEANRQIRWVPPEVGSGRFTNWLEGNVDWALSRNRFWGTPLNVWVCDSCDARHQPVSRQELAELSGRDCSELDLHRPYVDEVTFRCRAEGCQGVMHRTPEVIDAWFDSGSMPFAQYHYPFENKGMFENQFPADFISEGIDQTRGWFYTLLVISTFLFGHSSYKSCLAHELVLDRKGKKMSKSLGNVTDPREILRTEGADPLRWYMITSSPVWVPTRFDRESIKEAQRKLLATLENTYNFFALYANIDNFRPGDDGTIAPVLLDRWILSRLNSVCASVRADLEDLNFTRAAKNLGAFVTDDVSNWYVRLSRRRFWKGEMNVDKRTAFATLFQVLESTLRLLAPFVPFCTEEMFRGLMSHQDPDASVHLTDYPQADLSCQDADLESKMAAAQQIVGLGRSLRQVANRRIRQPLSRLLVHSEDDRARNLLTDDRLTPLVAEELNVKAVELMEDPSAFVELSAKPNFRALGPKFGEKAPTVAQRIEAMTPAEILDLRQQGKIPLFVGNSEVDLGFEEIIVAEAGIPPYFATSGNGFTIALDTTLTEDLVAEGLCREIINRVQNLRKKSGLDVSDRIQLSVTGEEKVLRVLGSFGERIAAETLANDLSPGLDLPHKEDFRVDDLEVHIALGKWVVGKGAGK